MAEILGVTPESVSRTVADFKRKGILQPETEMGNEMYHCKIAALEKEAEK